MALVNAQAAVLKVFQIVKALPADRIFASQAELDAARDSVERRGAPAPLTIRPAEPPPGLTGHDAPATVK